MIINVFEARKIGMPFPVRCKLSYHIHKSKMAQNTKNRRTSFVFQKQSKNQRKLFLKIQRRIFFIVANIPSLGIKTYFCS